MSRSIREHTPVKFGDGDAMFGAVRTAITVTAGRFSASSATQSVTTFVGKP